MENNQACVWSTRKALWDSFLNDPEIARAIDQLREENQQGKDANRADAPSSPATPEAAGRLAADDEQADNKEKQNIGARLRAYETPITDEILRQSIR